MSVKRTVINKLHKPSGIGVVTGQLYALGAPSWAKTAILSVKATTAGASTVDVKVVQAAPDGVATGNVDTGVACDQIAASATAVGRYAFWGAEIGAALAGTSIDGFVVPVSKNQKISLTTTGTVTDLDIWVEFIGE